MWREKYYMRHRGPHLYFSWISRAVHLSSSFLRVGRKKLSDEAAPRKFSRKAQIGPSDSRAEDRGRRDGEELGLISLVSRRKATARIDFSGGRSVWLHASRMTWQFVAVAHVLRWRWSPCAVTTHAYWWNAVVYREIRSASRRVPASRAPIVVGVGSRAWSSLVRIVRYLGHVRPSNTFREFHDRSVPTLRAS